MYAVRGRTGIVLIDVGGGTHTKTLLSNLREDLGASDIEAALITHSHPDHSTGAAEVRRMTGANILTSDLSRAAIETGDEIATGLSAARRAGIYPPDFQLAPCGVDATFHDGDVLELAGLKFSAIHVRGHSRDSFCFLTEVDGLHIIFAGDVLFYGGILGLINSECSEIAGYRADLCKLAGLKVDALLPGHGLFTLTHGQTHIDCALEQLGRNFLPRQIGQGDVIF